MKTLRHRSLNRWLIVRTGAVGDTILLSSLVQLIRRTIPEAWIELAGVYERVGLLVGPGLADRAVSIDDYRFERLFAPGEENSNGLAGSLREFDTILYFTNAKIPDGAAKLRSRVDQIVRIHPALPPVGPPWIHCVEHYAESLRGIVPVDPVPWPRIILREESRRRGIELLRKKSIDISGSRIVGVHVGAGSRTKLAPIHCFLREIDALRQAGPMVVLSIEGPADAEQVEAFLDGFPSEWRIPVARIREHSLLDLASILQQVDWFVGNDSGITHLSAALGRPTKAFFIASNPAVWAPLGSHVQVCEVNNER